MAKRAQRAQQAAMRDAETRVGGDEDDDDGAAAVIMHRDPWHPQRLEPVLVRMERTLLTDASVRARLAATHATTTTTTTTSASAAVLRPYLLLLQQAEARGASLATFMCIFDAAQRTAAQVCALFFFKYHFFFFTCHRRRVCACSPSLSVPVISVGRECNASARAHGRVQYRAGRVRTL